MDNLLKQNKIVLSCLKKKKIAKGLDRTVLTGSCGPTPVLTVHGISKKSGSLGLKNRFSRSDLPVRSCSENHDCDKQLAQIYLEAKERAWTWVSAQELLPQVSYLVNFVQPSQTSFYLLFKIPLEFKSMHIFAQVYHARLTFYIRLDTRHYFQIEREKYSLT